MATQIDDGGPAFPVLCDYIDGKPRGMQTHNRGGWHEELSMRDYFAGQAIAGAAFQLSSALAEENSGKLDIDRTAGVTVGLAGIAYLLADAMIAARNAKAEGAN